MLTGLPARRLRDATEPLARRPGRSSQPADRDDGADHGRGGRGGGRVVEPAIRPAVVRFVENWSRAAGRGLPEVHDHRAPEQAAVTDDRPLPLSVADRERLAQAARRALQVYPGAVGELLYREIWAFLDFGYRFGGSGPVLRLAAAIPDPDRPGPASWDRE